MKKLPAQAGKLIRAVVFTALVVTILVFLSYTLRPYSGSASRKNICGYYAEDEDSL
jgi:hypothetical protein